jgi:S-adenosylmethionine hydrolase
VTVRVTGAIFLLTDYGHADEFAGVVRAVIARDAPGAPVVDLTHEIPAFDVRAGALALVRCVNHLGPGVVVAVVDPGVGTERRALGIEVGWAGADPGGPSHLLGPDNGLLPWAADALGGARRAVSLPTHGTFDGRDVFAPVAARLWRGEPLESQG